MGFGNTSGATWGGTRGEGCWHLREFCRVETARAIQNSPSAPAIQLGIIVTITGWHVPDKKSSGGEGGIRTLDTGVSPYNGLANRRLQPLGHLSGV